MRVAQGGLSALIAGHVVAAGPPAAPGTLERLLSRGVLYASPALDVTGEVLSELDD